MKTCQCNHPIGAVYQRSPGAHPSRPRNSSPSPHKTSWATAPLAATLAIFTAGCAETATTTETPSTQTSEAADPLCSESAFLDFPIDRLARGTLVPIPRQTSEVRGSRLGVVRRRPRGAGLVYHPRPRPSPDRRIGGDSRDTTQDPQRNSDPSASRLPRGDLEASTEGASRGVRTPVGRGTTIRRDRLGSVGPDSCRWIERPCEWSQSFSDFLGCLRSVILGDTPSD